MHGPYDVPATLEVQLPAVRLSALTWGPADGPLVVALHGFPDTAWTWRHLGPVLAEEGYRVVAPHLRGYAPSGLATDGCYHVAALMADAAALHTELGGDERAMLVGHDWGAITANALGAHPASPYRRIVSLAVPPLTAVRTPGPLLGLRQLRNSWYILFHQLPFLPERVLEGEVRRLWRDWSPGYDATEDLGHVLTALREPAHRSAAIGYYRAMVRTWRVPAPYDEWATTWTGTPTVPTLLLHGADDGCMDARLLEGVETALPTGSRFETVASAGHFLQLEQPEVVNRLIVEHLSG